MSEERRKKGDDKKGGSTPNKVIPKVKDLFRKTKTKPYLLAGFCIFAKTTPESEMSESEFHRKLKEFMSRKVG